MSEYKDIKFSTLIDKVNRGICASLAVRPPVLESDYSETVAKAGSDLLYAWGYPLRLCYGYYGDFSVWTVDEAKDGILVAELNDRYEMSKGAVGKRTKQFKRFVKSGPCFDAKVSCLISRRKSGVSYRADETAWEIRKLGYPSPEEFVHSYNEAKKLIDDAFGVWHRYEMLSDKEKDLIGR